MNQRIVDSESILTLFIIILLCLGISCYFTPSKKRRIFILILAALLIALWAIAAILPRANKSIFLSLAFVSISIGLLALCGIKTSRKWCVFLSILVSFQGALWLLIAIFSTRNERILISFSFISSFVILVGSLGISSKDPIALFRKIKNKIKKYFNEYVLALRSNDPSQKRIIFESFRILGFSLIFLSVIIWLEIKKPEIFFDAEFDIRNPKILLTVLILADLVILCLFGLISWILCKKVFKKAFEKVLNSVKVALVKLSGIHPSRKEGIFVSLSVVLIGVLLRLLAVQFTLNNKIFLIFMAYLLVVLGIVNFIFWGFFRGVTRDTKKIIKAICETIPNLAALIVILWLLTAVLPNLKFRKIKEDVDSPKSFILQYKSIELISKLNSLDQSIFFINSLSMWNNEAFDTLSNFSTYYYSDFINDILSLDSKHFSELIEEAEIYDLFPEDWSIVSLYELYEIKDDYKAFANQIKSLDSTLNQVLKEVNYQKERLSSDSGK